MFRNMDFNLFTGILLIIDLLAFILFLRKNFSLKKEVLYFFIFIVPIINALILGPHYIACITFWFGDIPTPILFEDRSYVRSAYLSLGIINLLPLGMSIALLLLYNVKIKKAISGILLITIVIIQAISTMKLLLWFNSMEFARNPFCLSANILKLVATFYLFVYYRKLLKNTTVIKTCRNCNNISEPDATFCTYCGTKL